MPRVARLLLAAQLAFWGSILLCALITDEGFSHNHGPSFYGGRWSTIVPYGVGFVAAAGLMARAATLLERSGGDDERRLAAAIRLLVVLLLADLLTPDTVNQFFYDAHIVASVALFLFQALLGLWLVVRIARGPGYTALYATQIAGGLIAGASQAQWIGLLAPGIVVFQLAFGVLLVAATAELALGGEELSTA
jgi:hypothetical protein